MGLIETLKGWFSVPPPEGAYECTNCGTRTDSAASACPECGGEVAEIRVGAPYEFWGPMY